MPKNARERCIFSLRCPKIEHIPKKMHMPPRAKYIVQTIFAAFQGTTRRIVFFNSVTLVLKDL